MSPKNLDHLPQSMTYMNINWKLDQGLYSKKPATLSTKNKDVCYTALLRSLLEYASTIWDPLTFVNIQQLESVQRRSAKFVMNDYR